MDSKKILESVERSIQIELIRKSDEIILQRLDEFKKSLLKKRAEIVAQTMAELEITVSENVPDGNISIQINMGGDKNVQKLLVPKKLPISCKT